MIRRLPGSSRGFPEKLSPPSRPTLRPPAHPRSHVASARDGRHDEDLPLASPRAARSSHRAGARPRLAALARLRPRASPSPRRRPPRPAPPPPSAHVPPLHPLRRGPPREPPRRAAASRGRLPDPAPGGGFARGFPRPHHHHAHHHAPALGVVVVPRLLRARRRRRRPGVSTLRYRDPGFDPAPPHAPLRRHLPSSPRRWYRYDLALRPERDRVHARRLRGEAVRLGAAVASGGPRGRRVRAGGDQGPDAARARRPVQGPRDPGPEPPHRVPRRGVDPAPGDRPEPRAHQDGGGFSRRAAPRLRRAGKRKGAEVRQGASEAAEGGDRRRLEARSQNGRRPRGRRR